MLLIPLGYSSQICIISLLKIFIYKECANASFREIYCNILQLATIRFGAMAAMFEFYFLILDFWFVHFIFMVFSQDINIIIVFYFPILFYIWTHVICNFITFIYKHNMWYNEEYPISNLLHSVLALIWSCQVKSGSGVM